MRELVIVLIGVSASVAIVYFGRFVKGWKAEWRAVRAFREAYRDAKARAEEMRLIGLGGTDEHEVIAYAAELLRTREDIKCGRHRFGQPAREMIMAGEEEYERERYRRAMTSPLSER